MGSALIGYILEGPSRLENAVAYRNAIGEARDRILGRAADPADGPQDCDGRMFERFTFSGVDGDGNPLDVDEEEMLRDELDGLLQRVLGDEKELLPWTPIGDPALDRRLAMRLACRSVRQFRRLWLGGIFARDLMSRFSASDPNVRILVAAGASWGDPPNGWAYSIVRLAELLGIIRELDIG
ncbi:MAG: hypothetical protein WBQ66_15480 [Blastocatellia bacterium]